jgi:glyoxylase-like metal-dependent hydrolase (beta-lactamase superfamily II)/rhodanese-related sulfurtransferase
LDILEMPKGGKMSLQSYDAQDLFDYLVSKDDFVLLDVRNDVEFGRFKVEGPYPVDMVNVPYMEFIEHEEESVAKVPSGRKIRIVCAKEGSAKYVGEILNNHGFEDVHYLREGIKSWGNLLTPIKVSQESAYDLYQFRRPGKASCSYGLVYAKEMMLFDPAKNIAAYQEFAEKQGCSITHTFETHRQADYISGSQPLNQAVGAVIMAPELDFNEAKFLYTPVKDGDIYPFSENTNAMPEVKVLHTPGHTPGSTCYLIDNKYLITGDTVFIYSIGRPDLGGMAEAWSAMLFKTMREKILNWDDNIHVLPGHYMSWEEADPELRFMELLGKIKTINSKIYSIDNREDFYQFIKSNLRPQPEEYAKIREINAGLVQVNEEQQDVMDLGKNECAASAQPH